jgi:2-polyprenyl-3-methyl-5-hydroxy-6-metoxy-1,4-benzoquinol methylase
MNEEIDSPFNGFKAQPFDEIRTTNIIQGYGKKLGIKLSTNFSLPTVKIYRCNGTGYKFYFPFNLAGDSEFYESLNATSSYHSSWKREFQIAIDLATQIGTDANVLDVGCGFGAFLFALKEKGFRKTRGLEFNDAAVKAACEKGLKVTRDSVEDHAAQMKGQYDLVTCFQVLEHVSQVQQFIGSLVSLLKPGGKLVIAVPNNVPFFAGCHILALTNLPPHHMGLWNYDALKALEKLYKIELIRHDYDQVIGFGYYLVFLARYVISRPSTLGFRSRLNRGIASLRQVLTEKEKVLNRVIVVQFEKV